MWLNLKKITVKYKPNLVKISNKSMKSKGQNQGYQCIKCGKIYKKTKLTWKFQRKIQTKMYIPDVSAHRHLSRPLTRLGKLNRKSKFDESTSWFSVYEN